MGTAAGTAGTVSGLTQLTRPKLLLDELVAQAIATDLVACGIYAGRS